MSVLKRRDVAQTSVEVSGPPGKDHFSVAFPGIFEFLTALSYESGDRRVGGTLTLFWDDGLFKVCANDRDQGLTCFVAGSSLSAALGALEEGLQGDTLQWRKPTAVGRKKRA